MKNLFGLEKISWYSIQWRLEFCLICLVAAGFGFCNGCLLAACYLNGLECEALRASIGG